MSVPGSPCTRVASDRLIAVTGGADSGGDDGLEQGLHLVWGLPEVVGDPPGGGGQVAGDDAAGEQVEGDVDGGQTAFRQPLPVTITAAPILLWTVLTLTGAAAATAGLARRASRLTVREALTVS